MNNNYYKSPEPTWIMRKFWKAAGADSYLLERSTYSDQIKYFCLGGIVVATGVMAALAGGYAIYTIFEPKGNALDTDIHIPTMFMSMIFGIIWGLIIYNIDRFIVTSTGKGDGTEAITKQEIKSAIPRIIMGMIIALTISKPIEIRMFKSEIDQALFQKQEKIKEKDKKEAELSYQKDINELKTERERLLNETNQKEQIYLQLADDARREMDGTGGSGIRDQGPIYEKKNADAISAKEHWESTKKTNNAEIKKLDTRIFALESEKGDKIKNAERKAEKLDGLLERIKLAHVIAGFWVSLFITLLFMVIELTPIFFKMMLIKGPYDYMDENIKELARAEAGIEIEYDFYKDKNGMEKHKIINHGAELKMKERKQILEAQEAINAQIISKWKAAKLKDIDTNPTNYFEED